jgi:D-glycero-D-manno-heptose 1,7-bisphosphate phosphatase
MLFTAAGKHNIDLSASIMVGDGERDMEAGRAAGCKTALIAAGSPFPSLAEFTKAFFA